MLILKQMGEEWNDSTQSREQIEARLASKQEAAMRRERALAYAFSHQVLNSPLYRLLDIFGYPMFGLF